MEAAPRLWRFDIDGTLVAQSADQLEAWVAVFRQEYALTVATPRDRLAAAGPDLLVSDLIELLARLRQHDVPWLLSVRSA